MDFFLAPVNSEIQAQGVLLEQQIYIDKSKYGGDDLTLSGVYVHPWIPNWGSINITTGGFEFSWGSGFGDRWSWQANFNPQ